MTFKVKNGIRVNDALLVDGSRNVTATSVSSTNAGVTASYQSNTISATGTTFSILPTAVTNIDIGYFAAGSKLNVKSDEFSCHKLTATGDISLSQTSGSFSYLFTANTSFGAGITVTNTNQGTIQISPDYSHFSSQLPDGSNCGFAVSTPSNTATVYATDGATSYELSINTTSATLSNLSLLMDKSSPITALSSNGVLQIGLSSGNNGVFDGITWQSRNNGAAQVAKINPYGGDVYLGNSEFIKSNGQIVFSADGVSTSARSGAQVSLVGTNATGATNQYCFNIGHTFSNTIGATANSIVMGIAISCNTQDAASGGYYPAINAGTAYRLDSYGIYVYDLSKGKSARIREQHGVFVQNQTKGTTCAAYRAGNQVGTTLSHNLPYAFTLTNVRVSPKITLTGMTANGTTMTFTYAAQGTAPFVAGDKIVVSGATPTGYNGTWTVATCNTTTITVTTATNPGAATVMGAINNNLRLTVATSTDFTQLVVGDYISISNITTAGVVQYNTSGLVVATVDSATYRITCVSELTGETYIADTAVSGTPTPTVTIQQNFNAYYIGSAPNYLAGALLLGNYVLSTSAFPRYSNQYNYTTYTGGDTPNGHTYTGYGSILSNAVNSAFIFETCDNAASPTLRSTLKHVLDEFRVIIGDGSYTTVSHLLIDGTSLNLSTGVLDDQVAMNMTASALSVTTGNAVQRLYVGSSGALCFGAHTSQTVGGNTAGISVQTSSNYLMAYCDSGTPIYAGRTGATPVGVMVQFYTGATLAGGITVATFGATPTFTASSDYRLKTDIKRMTGCLSRIMGLKPSWFKMKADPDQNEIEGFIADEYQQYMPKSVWGEKDAVDADGNPIYQTIEIQGLIPVLVGALQEAVARIEELEQKLP